MTRSPVDICNEALAQIAEIPSALPISSLNPPAGDSLAAANACSILYQPIYLAVLRQYEWDFARTEIFLDAAPAAHPPPPWPYIYFYPPDCIQIRQIAPGTGLPDPFDPQPIRHAVLSSGGVKYILTTEPSAIIVYTAQIDDPTLWDTAFQEAMVRALASALALTLAGRPDFSREKMTEAAQFESIAESRRS